MFMLNEKRLCLDKFGFMYKYIFNTFSCWPKKKKTSSRPPAALVHVCQPTLKLKKKQNLLQSNAL